MNCTEARALLHAYLDDELDAARSAEIAQHLSACAECMARYRTLEKLQQSLRVPRLRHAAPPALAARIRAHLPDDAPARIQRRMWQWPALSAALAASLLIAVAIAGWQAVQLRAHGTDALVTEAVSDHVRSLLASHLIDVRSSDQHTVKPWFDGRLDFSPQVKDLGAQGFELIGGRLDVLGDERVAALVYKRHLHMINLFQWPANGASSEEPKEQSRNGYHAIFWREGGMQFLAVSDTADLNAFVQDFRAAAALGSEPR
ncbi:MAG TPA: anti-sigma factor [Rhodanobacteraceae bacterium]|nr:anti-sigma factor [Rhodanobacteraceae bacterium]